MKLIATLGATSVNIEHTYHINGKDIDKPLSFLALKEYFNIKDSDVVILGTKQTKEKLKDYIENYEFKELDINNFGTIFAKVLEVMEKGDILDLTQSFRSISFAPLLAYHFSKEVGKNLQDIFYAQIKKSDCDLQKEKCEFEFISLKKYEDITDLLREINVFLSSWYVTNFSKEEDFKIVHNNLVDLSKKYIKELSD